MLGCCSIVSCCMLSSIRSRWSLYRFQPKSSHLSSGILGLPRWCLFIFSLPEHAYALHITSRISCHVLHHVAWALHHDWLLVLLLVFLLWVEPGNQYVIEEPVEYANKDQAFVNSENFPGKMTIPSKSLLSLLASCSLYCYAVIPTICFIMPPILPCQTSNPPFLANRCLAMLPLCSASLIALLVAGEDEVCSMLEHGYLLGYHYYILFTLMHLYTW